MDVDVGAGLGVGDSSPAVWVIVGTNVMVAVWGAGEGNKKLVGVGAACGTNSTSEMDNAPTVNPIEIRATTSAFLRSRMPCIISFL